MHMATHSRHSMVHVLDGLGHGQLELLHSCADGQTPSQVVIEGDDVSENIKLVILIEQVTELLHRLTFLPVAPCLTFQAVLSVNVRLLLLSRRVLFVQ